MRRKFSFDIPKLKLSTATKPGNTTAAPDTQNERPESPPTPVTPIPQTLIHLPTELDAALRRACTLVVEPHRASNDVFDFQCEATRAAVNYATIKGGLDAMLDNERPTGGAKYSYKPDVPVQDLFKNEDRAERLWKQTPQVQLLQSAAAARVEHLMAPAKESASLKATQRASTAPVQQRSMTVITDSADSPTLSPTGSVDFSKPPSAHSDRSLKVSKDAAARALRPDDVLPLHPLQQNPPAPELAESDNSSPQSPVDDEDDEHNRWNNSTGMTSAVITPAKGHTSKRESEQRPAGSNNRDVDVDRSQSHASDAGVRTSTGIRKVSSSDSRPGSRQAGEYSRSTFRTDDQDEHNALSRSTPSQQAYRAHQNPDTSRPNPRSREQHAYQPPRSDSRAEYDPFSSQQVYQPLGMPARPLSTDPTHNSRPRTGSLSQHVREYFRPGSTTASRKPSVDLARQPPPPRPASRTGGGRSRTHSRGRGDSIDAAYDESAAADSSIKRSTSISRWRPWRSNGQGKQFPTPDYSRPGSATGWLSHRTRSRSGTGDSTSMDASTPASSVVAQSLLERNDSATAGTKKAINLNRELPPLPGLDQWRPEWDENAHGNWGKANERQKAVELRDRQAQQEEVLAARMGPVSPPQTQRDPRHDQQQRSAPLHGAGRHSQSQTQSRSQSRTDSRQTGHSSNASTSTQQYPQSQSRRETPSPTTRNMHTSTSSGKVHASSPSYGGAPISIYNHSTNTTHTRTTSQMNSHIASRQQMQHVQLLPASQGKSASVSPLSLCPPSPGTVASASASNSATTTPADFHTPPVMPSPYLVSPLDAPGGSSRWSPQNPLPMQPSPRIGHSRASSAGAERILSRSTDASALPSPRLANGERSPAFGGSATHADSRLNRALPSSPPLDRKYSLDGGLALSSHTYNPRWAAAAAAAHSQEMLQQQHHHHHAGAANHGYSPQNYTPATPKKDVASPTEKLLRRKWWLPSKEKDRADRDRRAPAFLKALAA